MAFAALGYILSWLGMFQVMSESGEANVSPLCNVLVYVSSWPSFLLGFRDPEIFDTTAFIMNASGWAIVGLSVAFISSVRSRRMLNKPFDAMSQ